LNIVVKFWFAGGRGKPAHHQRPRRSIEMRTPPSRQRIGKGGAGELTTWPVLKISGRRPRTRERQNDTSIVFGNRQESTARLAQSMIATR
jgi:hypothetical protein